MDSPKPRVITGWDLGKLLHAAGVIPDNCGHVVIDIPVDGPVVIYQCVFGDERLLKVVTNYDFGPVIESTEPGKLMTTNAPE